MKLLEILTTLLLSLILVSSSNFSSELNPDEVEVSNASIQLGYSPLPASELHSLLKDAVSRNDPNQVRTLLENHIPISQSTDETLKQSVSYSPTDTSISSNPNEFDINAIISDQRTLLHWAAGHGHSDLIPVLLIRDADVNSKCDIFTKTPLMCAALGGHDAVVALLLNTLAIHPERIYSLIATQNNDGMTALHLAAESGHGAVVALLLNALAIQPERMHSLIMARISNGTTALHHAAFRGHDAVVALLLNALAIQPERMHSLIMAQDSIGMTALHYAAYNSHEAVFAQLLNALANQPELMHSLIITKSNYGRTVFYYACLRCDENTIKLLLELYKEALDKIASDTSSSADRLSSTYGSFVNLMKQEISWALDSFIKHNCVEIIDLLAKFGANLDVRDENGDTPLHRAARAERSAVVIALVENDAESQKNNAGETPLDVAHGLTPEALSLLEECAARIILK